MQNLLAIVIPYYKPDFFEETLKSVASQTDKRFTLYIGNDASPDDPFPLIEKYFPDGNYHYFDYKENLGGKNLAMQWERILENVKEEWFQILGDDDLISDNFVEAFYKNLPEINQNNCNVVKFSQCWINEDGHKTRAFTQYNKLIPSIENWANKHIHGHASSLSEHVFRKKAYQKYGFRHFPLAWGTDDVAVLELSEGKDIFFISEAKVFVRLSSENISGKTDNMKEKNIAKHYLEEFYIKNYYKNLPKDYVSNKIYQHIHYAFRNKPSDLKLNLFKLYWHLKDYRKILTLPKTYFHLYFQ